MMLHIDVRQQNTYIDFVCVYVWVGVCGHYVMYMRIWQHVLLEMLTAP